MTASCHPPETTYNTADRCTARFGSRGSLRGRCRDRSRCWPHSGVPCGVLRRSAAKTRAFAARSCCRLSRQPAALGADDGRPRTTCAPPDCALAAADRTVQTKSNTSRPAGCLGRGDLRRYRCQCLVYSVGECYVLCRYLFGDDRSCPPVIVEGNLRAPEQGPPHLDRT